MFGRFHILPVDTTPEATLPMPICSYLAVPSEGTTDRLEEQLKRIPGCQVARAQNRELLLLVTETESPEEDEALRFTLQGIDELQALIFTFGDVDPETDQGDPLARGREAAKEVPR